MKCPKCGYLGFEPVDRCRNCGYEFSLSSSVTLPELPLRSEAPDASPLDDLDLLDERTPQAAPVKAATVPPPRSGSDLPLFGEGDGEPLITRASPPRPPLAVRRAPEVPRTRAEPARTPSFDLDLSAPLPSHSVVPAARARSSWPETGDGAEAPAEDAGLGARFMAMLIDLLILASVDAAVIYFTMQICGIGLTDLDVLPKGPLLAFLLVQNGGYLIVFTAGGQTLGKMAAGIRVVAVGSESPLDLGRAMLRTGIWLILAIPAGLGLLSALFSRDHRGLHDRFANTRVVRA